MTRDELLQAIAHNHRVWFVRVARASGGELVAPGVTYADRVVTIAFPSQTLDLDYVVRFARRRRAREIGCWTHGDELADSLRAHGFRAGRRPYWLALDLRRLRSSRIPRGVRIELVREPPDWEVGDLPYYAHDQVWVDHPRVRHVAAFRGERVIGQAMVSLTGGRHGVGGIFDVGVVPRERGLGIGRALTDAVCAIARDAGCSHAVLDATPAGKVLYERLGFVSLGLGRTWWLR